MHMHASRYIFAPLNNPVAGSGSTITMNAEFQKKQKPARLLPPSQPLGRLRHGLTLKAQQQEEEEQQPRSGNEGNQLNDESLLEDDLSDEEDQQPRREATTKELELMTLKLAILQEKRLLAEAENKVRVTTRAPRSSMHSHADNNLHCAYGAAEGRQRPGCWREAGQGRGRALGSSPPGRRQHLFQHLHGWQVAEQAGPLQLQAEGRHALPARD